MKDRTIPPFDCFIIRLSYWTILFSSPRDGDLSDPCHHPVTRSCQWCSVIRGKEQISGLLSFRLPKMYSMSQAGGLQQQLCILHLLFEGLSAAMWAVEDGLLCVFYFP